MADIHLDVALTFNEEQSRLLETYWRLLVDWNERMNLTGITDKTEVFVKHFLDSVAVMQVPVWNEHMVAGTRVIDVGSGAGFPGLPLAICMPQVQFVLCDSLLKRVSFLNAVISELRLQNVIAVHARAEDAARDVRYRGKFDAVVARAVAKLNVLFELMSPFCNQRGHLYAFKGPNVQDEYQGGARAATQLGMGELEIVEFSLPNEAGHRTIVIGQQQTRTSKLYPRVAGVLQKQPL